MDETWRMVKLREIKTNIRFHHNVDPELINPGLAKRGVQSILEWTPAGNASHTDLPGAA